VNLTVTQMKQLVRRRGVLATILTFSLPLALGFFLSLWLIAPVAEELRIGHVITRAVLAVGVGSTVAFVVIGVTGILGSFVFDNSFFGNSFPMPSYQGSPIAPQRVLAGVLLWRWRSTHRVEYVIEGLIDV